MAEDYERVADSAERELADLERTGEQVEQHIREARDDWKRKQADPNVPGADAPDHDQIDSEITGGGSHGEN